MGLHVEASGRLLWICLVGIFVGMVTGQENVDQLVLCQNSGVKHISCTGAQVIETISAFWGRGNDVRTCPHVTATGNEICSDENVPTVFQEICDGRTQCAFDTNDKIWGTEVCPGVSKILSLTYSCIDCTNRYADDNKCEEWALDGQCAFNREWMVYNCKKTCERCGDWTPAIVNLHTNDTECDYWASTGSCRTNPVFMIINCRQSCTNSLKKIDCNENRHDNMINQRDCQLWADLGFCQMDSLFMMASCSKSCFGCNDDDKIRCENKLSDTECEDIQAAGNCSTDPGYAITNCFKTCLECTADPVCMNVHTNDTECDIWANYSPSQCVENPLFMYSNCWKSCMLCDGTSTELTECGVNKYDRDRDADNCDARQQQGQCITDRDNMFYNCTKSCFACDEDNRELRCENIYGDVDCKRWADDGQCESNPGFMIPMCMKSCLQCTSDPVCEDKYGVSNCNYWASIGECKTNPTWMHANCMSTCIGCTSNLACENIKSNTDCEYWMRFGGCSNNIAFMMFSCSGACTRCEPEINGIPDCIDSFADCGYWYDNGDCPKNPTWLQHYCRKSCTHCDQLGPTTTTSTTMAPGSVTTVTSDTQTTTRPTTTTTRPTTTTTRPTTTTTTHTTTTTRPTMTAKPTTTTTRPTTTTTRPTMTTTRPTTTTTRPTTTTTRRTTTTATPTMSTTRPTTTTSRPTTTTTRPTTTTTRRTTTTTRATTTTATTEAVQVSTQFPQGAPLSFGPDIMNNSPPWRTSVNNLTAKKSFLPPSYIGQRGTLKSFMVRLISDTAVDLDIWRLNMTTTSLISKYFERIYSQKDVSINTGMVNSMVTSVHVGECIEVEKGDVIGFTTYGRTPSPISYRRIKSDIIGRTYFRRSDVDSMQSGFLSMIYPFEFGLQVEVNYGERC